MKKLLLLALLFAAYSTALFAQDRPQHFPQENSLINRHQHMPVTSPEINFPLNGELESVDELYRHQAGPDAFMPRGDPEKNAQSTNELVYVCDSAFRYTTTGGQYKTIYTRDAAGRVLTRLAQTWNSGSTVWTNTSKRNYSYNASGKILVEESLVWDNGSTDWKNQEKVSNIYDASGNLVSELYQIWYVAIGEWLNYRKDSYSYDASENKLASLYQEWDTGIDNWINSQKTNYSYSSTGDKLAELIQYWDIGIYEWRNVYKFNLTYDASGNLVSDLLQIWNSAVSNWRNYDKLSYSYDASGNRLSMLKQLWENDNWVNYSKDNNTYDASGNRLSMLQQLWETVGGEWVNNFKRDFEYNYISKKVTGISYEWSGAWIPSENRVLGLTIYNNHLYSSNNGYKAEAYYSSYSLGIEDKDVQAKANTSFCSPNPAKDLVNVANQFKKEASLKIYNMKGQLVNEKLLSTGQNQISIQNLTPGIYLFIMQSESSKIQNKVVVY